MTAKGLVVIIGMLLPPIAGFFALRRAKWSVLSALGGAVILWAVCTVVFLFVVLVANRLQIDLDLAMWFYLPLLALVLIGMLWKHWKGN